MSLGSVDPEKGDAGFKVSEAQAESATASPVSPNFSTAATWTARSSTDSKSKEGNVEPAVHPRRPTFFASIIALLTGRKKNQPDDPEHNAPDADQTADNSDDEDDTGSDEDEDEDEDDSDKDDSKGEISKVRAIHRQPKGYPRFATFLDSDENFTVYRRFGYLQTRLLLEKQDELRILECKLDTMEIREKRNSPESLKCRTDISASKRELLELIETKYNAYCQLMANASVMTALNKPTSGEQRSVANWLEYNNRVLNPHESSFIYHREDLITLRPGREHAWLDSGIEKILQWVGWAPIRQAFQSRDTRRKSNGKDGSVLYTRSRIENVVVGIITMVILALLVIPIWLLYRLSEADTQGPDAGQITYETSLRCIGVLLVSTLAFSACISLFTRAKRHEILAASAGYCAVLVVFIGNIGHS